MMMDHRSHESARWAGVVAGLSGADDAELAEIATSLLPEMLPNPDGGWSRSLAVHADAMTMVDLVQAEVCKRVGLADEPHDLTTEVTERDNGGGRS